MEIEYFGDGEALQSRTQLCDPCYGNVICCEFAINHVDQTKFYFCKKGIL